MFQCSSELKLVFATSMTSGGGGDEMWQLSGSSETQEVPSDTGEPWDAWAIAQENKRRHLLREFPDLDAEDNPCAVFGWSIVKRRRILCKAREEVERQKTLDSLKAIGKEIRTKSWTIVIGSEML